MNIYVVLEGERAAVAIYRSWIGEAYPAYTIKNYAHEVTGNSIFIQPSGGWPNYFGILERAIEDVNSMPYDRLVVAVDSENMSYEEKHEEIHTFVTARGLTKELHILVQHFCFEAWALGNRHAITGTPYDPKLREYLDIHDVREKDPELLPNLPSEDLNRSQFAFRYLRKATVERNRRFAYSKSSPGMVAQSGYYARLVRRLETTSHISSFGLFASAFE